MQREERDEGHREGNDEERAPGHEGQMQLVQHRHVQDNEIVVV